MKTALPAVSVALCLVLSCASDGAVTTVESAPALDRYVGRNVELRGRISDVVWQHLVGSFPGRPHSYYFDVGSSQIIIYSAAPIDCRDSLAVRGRVVEIRGPSKRPGNEGSTKVDESYAEYHILVDTWRCLTSAAP